MTTEKKKFANHVKNASAPLRYDSRCMGARWGGRGSDFQKSRSREPPYTSVLHHHSSVSFLVTSYPTSHVVARGPAPGL